jgi:hypothetical protein
MGYIGNQSLTVLQKVSIGQVVGTDTAASILVKPNDNGALWVSSDTGHLYLNDGTQWVDLGELRGDTGPAGPAGATGVSITDISRTSGDGSLGTTDTYTITFSDASTSTFDVANGNSIDHLTRTVGTGAEGTTDTYTVYGDAGETVNLGTFDVYNGADGTVIDHLTRTVGDGSSGSTDTYTIYGDVAETEVLGTFDVYNGSDGIMTSVVAGTGISVDSTDPANPVINVTGLVGSIDDLSDVDTTTSAPTDGQALIWNATDGEWQPGEVSSGATYTKTEFVATEGQTTFTVDYTVGKVDVYLNGLRLLAEDFTATNGTSVILAIGATLNDVVEVVAYDTFDVADTYTIAQADAAFEPADATILKDADIGVNVQGYNANTTTQGNTFNGASQLVQLDGTGKLPAIDGSALTNLAGGGVGEYIDNSIAISSDGSALANDDGTNNRNIGIGINAGNSITTAVESTIIGYNAGVTENGGSNTFIGSNSGLSTTTGYNNTAVGKYSGAYITTGINNTAIGNRALNGSATSRLTGSYNTGIGYQSGYNLTTGQYNVLMGYQAGYNLTSGWNNIAIGQGTGYQLTSGTRNTFVGFQAGYTAGTGDDNVCIGANARPSSTSVSNEFTLGYTNITSLRCAVTTITSLSDERDKDNITDLDAGLDFINTLRPVRFDWNMRDGGKVGENDIGFIAQELQQAQVDNGIKVPHLVMDENPDKLEAGYGMLIAPMVKAIKELSAKVDSLESELNSLKGI